MSGVLLHGMLLDLTWALCLNRTYLFDDASDAGDSAYASALKLGHLQLAVEHAAQEGGVLVHLERRPLQLQLLHDAHRGVQV